MEVINLTRKITFNGTIDGIKTETWIINEYVGGTSELAISNALNVGRSVIRRVLLEHGIEPRDRSAAGLVRASKMSHAERLAQSAAAHEAMRGSKRARAEIAARARTIQRLANSGEKSPSPSEGRMLGWLDERAIEYTRECAVGTHNIDILVGCLAVEIFGGNWHGTPSRRTRDVRTFNQITDANLSLLVVWDSCFLPMQTICADQVISYANIASTLPAGTSKYWVIRGDGKLTSCGSGYIDDSALILPSQC